MKLDRVIAVRNSKTVFRDGDKCIKVFNKEYSKADVLSEALNHAIVEQTGLPVPSILEVVRIDGKWAIVMEYIRGTTLAQLMDRTSGQGVPLMERFVDLQLEVHRTDCSQLGSFLDQLREQLTRTPLDPELQKTLFRRADREGGGVGLCHGDFDPTNIIVTGEGLMYILDWSRAARGGAAADAAATLLQFLLRDEEKRACSYLELYCTKSGIPPEQIRSWLPAVAAARMERGREWERDRLKQWLDVPLGRY